MKQNRWVREHKQPRSDYVRSKVPMVARPKGLDAPSRRVKSRPSPPLPRRNQQARVRSISSHGGGTLRGGRDKKKERVRVRTPSPPPASSITPERAQETPPSALSPHTPQHTRAMSPQPPGPGFPKSTPSSRGSSPGGVGMDISSRQTARMSQRYVREQSAVKVLTRQQQLLDLKSIKEKNNLDNLLPTSGYEGYFVRLFAERRVKRIIGECCVKVMREVVKKRIAADKSREDEVWAVAVLIRAWKNYMLRSFNWHLVKNLMEHKARVKQAATREHDAFRLRAAYRRVDETEALLNSEMYSARLKKRHNHEAWLVMQEELKKQRENELNEAEERKREAFLLAEKAKAQLEQERKMKAIANNVVKFGGKRMSGYSGLAKKKRRKKRRKRGVTISMTMRTRTHPIYVTSRARPKKPSIRARRRGKQHRRRAIFKIGCALSV